MYATTPLTQFLDLLASSAPEPGGGAAAALVGATGAALVGMVANLTVGKEKFAAVAAEMEEARAQAESLRQKLVAAIDQDSAAFRQVMAAYRLPRETDERKAARKQAIQAALREATQVPAGVVRLCEEVAAWSRVAAEKGNPQVISDAAVAALLADAAAQGAALNVRINLVSLSSPLSADPLWAEIQRRLDGIRAVRDDVLQTAYEKIG